MLLLAVVRFFFFLLGNADIFHFLGCLHSSLLRASPDTIRWIAHNRIKHPVLSKQGTRAVHGEDVGERQAVVVEVGEDVESLDLVEVSNLVPILALSAHSVAFEHPHVYITPKANCSKELASSKDASSTHEWVVDEISLLHLALVRHQEGQLVVGGSRAQVWPHFQVELGVEGVVFLRFFPSLSLRCCRFSVACNAQAEVHF